MIPPANCLPRRRKCAATTRETILAAAHERFLAESYDTVSLRDVARDAGVDVALVSRYFGTKEELFRQVLRASGGPRLELPATPDELPAFFVGLLAQQGEPGSSQHCDKLLMMLRSASSMTAADLIQQKFDDDVLKPLAETIGGAEANAKATLVMAVFIGSNFLQTILPVKPLSPDEQSCFRSELLRVFEGVLEPGC